MTGDEERELNSIGVQIFGKQLVMLDDTEMTAVLAERGKQLRFEKKLKSERYFADEMDGYFADPLGFYDPQKAAEHAVIVQLGYSTPLREAARMIADGGIGAQRARTWMAAHGYTDEDLER